MPPRALTNEATAGQRPIIYLSSFLPPKSYKIVTNRSPARGRKPLLSLGFQQLPPSFQQSQHHAFVGDIINVKGNFPGLSHKFYWRALS